MSRHVLLIGGCGFIGAHVARAFAKRGDKVTIIERSLAPGSVKERRLKDVLAHDNVSFVKADATRLDEYASVVDAADVIIPFVWSRAGEPAYLTASWALNVGVPVSILERVRTKNPKALVVHCGTRYEYGTVATALVNEDVPCRPTEAYGLQKLAAEQYALYYHRMHDVHAVCLRLSNVYGPGGEKESRGRGNIVERVINVFQDDGTFTITGKGAQLKDFVFVNDVVNAFLAVVNEPSCVGNVYNVGSGQGISFKEAVETVHELVGKGTVAVDDEAPSNDPSFVADIARLHGATGWQPSVSFVEGVKLLLAAATSRRERG